MQQLKVKLTLSSVLKENVIIGKLIPAGTGMSRYRNIKVQPLDEDDEKDEVEVITEAK